MIDAKWLCSTSIAPDCNRPTTVLASSTPQILGVLAMSSWACKRDLGHLQEGVASSRLDAQQGLCCKDGVVVVNASG